MLYQDKMIFDGRTPCVSRVENRKTKRRGFTRRLDAIVLVSRYAAGGVPVDASIRPTPF
jgi:hypothetical protein